MKTSIPTFDDFDDLQAYVLEVGKRLYRGGMPDADFHNAKVTFEPVDDCGIVVEVTTRIGGRTIPARLNLFGTVPANGSLH